MQLANIKEFLEKYRAKLSEAEGKQEDVIAIIATITQVTLSPEMFSVERGILILRTSPVIKNELFMYKEKILSALRERGRKDIVDMR